MEFALIFGLLSAVILLGAWRDHAGGNRRDAGLLAGIGLCTGLGAVAAAVI
jgi:hypothetical protein